MVQIAIITPRGWTRGGHENVEYSTLLNACEFKSNGCPMVRCGQSGVRGTLINCTDIDIT